MDLLKANHWFLPIHLWKYRSHLCLHQSSSWELWLFSRRLDLVWSLLCHWYCALYGRVQCTCCIYLFSRFRRRIWFFCLGASGSIFQLVAALALAWFLLAARQHASRCRGSLRLWNFWLVTSHLVRSNCDTSGRSKCLKCANPWGNAGRMYDHK